jgi:hypothetical protein
VSVLPSRFLHSPPPSPLHSLLPCTVGEFSLSPTVAKLLKRRAADAAKKGLRPLDPEPKHGGLGSWFGFGASTEL